MNILTKPITIAVTGLNASDNPGPGVAVIRAIREAFGDAVRIIGLAYESLEPGIYLNNVADQVYQIPYPTAGATALAARLEYIHNIEKLDLVIPNFDSELYNFIRIAPQLALMGIKTFLPTHEQLASRDKVNLGAFGKKHGFEIPEQLELNNTGDIHEAAHQLEYPMVIKGKFYEAYVVQNQDAAQKKFYELSSKWGLPVIAQKFIQGTEINVAGLGNGKGEAISVVPMRKLYITDKGKAWAGITIEDEELLNLGRQFAESTGWKGGFELEVMRDADDKLFIMEINPRFPAWIYLTAAAGQNQPAALVKMALGELVEPFTDYLPGKLFIRYSWDEVVDISQFQQFSAFGNLSHSKASV